MVQLAYFLTTQPPLIHAAYSSTELLVFGVTCVIADIDFNHGSFSWLDRVSLLSELGLNAEQFIDACVLAGFDSFPTSPIVEENSPVKNAGWQFKSMFYLFIYLFILFIYLLIICQWEYNLYFYCIFSHDVQPAVKLSASTKQAIMQCIITHPPLFILSHNNS